MAEEWRRLTIGFTEDEWRWLHDPATLQGRKVGQFVRHLVDQARAAAQGAT